MDEATEKPGDVALNRSDDREAAVAVLPLYNNRETIVDAIGSVLAQDASGRRDRCG